MADTTTPVYSFVLPEIDGSDGTWGTKLNANLTALDGLLSGSANLQNASFTGTASFGGSTGTAGQVLKSQGAGANAIWTDDSNTTYTAGSGLSLTGTEFANTAPDQTVVMNAGSGISVSGTYPTFTVTNSSPDQTVGLTGTGGTTISGTYPNFTINSTDNNTTYTAGTGLTLTSTEFSVTDNGIGATQLNVSGNGTSGQLLASDGDGTFSWQTGGSGGNETLAQTLALGNTTGGTDLSVSSGDNIVMAANSTVDGRDVSVDGAKLDLINQGVATTDSPAFAGATLTSALNITPTSGYANIELGGVDGAFIDLKAPDSDDYDMRLITSGGSGGTIDVGAAGDLSLRAGGSERVTLLSNGQVGIGTASPTRELDIVGDIGISGRIKPTAAAGTTTAAAPRICIGYDWDTGLFQDTTNTIGFSTAGTERMRIDTLGRVALEIATSTGPILSCKNTSGTDSGFSVTPYGGTTKLDAYLPSFGSGQHMTFRRGSSGETMRCASNGRVGIGTTAPAQALHVVGSIVATGNITAYYSDERLKDFKGKIDNPLEKLNTLNGYYFKPNETAILAGAEQNGLEVGVSAQEVEKVLPEIVSPSALGKDYKTVSYEKLTPLLIEAVKELSAKVDDLELRLQNLEK